MTRATLTSRWVSCLAVLLLLGARAAPSEESLDAPSKNGKARPSLPAVPLAGLPGIQNEAEHLKSIRDRASELANSAGTTEDPQARVELLLAAANLILAHELEPACSRSLLGLPSKPEEVDAVREALDRARASLEKADAELAAPPEGSEDVKNVRYRFDTLRAFEEALRGYLLADTESDPRKGARRAASRLSVLLEDSNPLVVASAALWYASLRGREADREAALLVLDLPLSDPKPQAMPHAFFARLLRCRLLAEQGGYAAALALLMQMEEQCERWFVEESDRDNARRAALWIEIEVLGAWHGRLNDPAQSTERNWCADRMTTLSKEGFGSEPATVLRLNLAVPLLAPPPKTEAGSAPLPNDRR